jgi:pilus assembly protein CpaF
VSFEVILPVLEQIAPYILDPDISEVMVNGSKSVYIERNGCLQRIPGVCIDDRTLQVAARLIARALGYEINENNPLVDARLEDGSRVAIVFTSCAPDGVALSIRKFQNHRYSAEALVEIGALPREVLCELKAAVEGRETILLSGGAGTGKTTLLNALGAFIDPEDRVIVIEDTSEVAIAHPHLVRLEARRDPPVTTRDLLKAYLRMRPDRILIGEVRGGEAFDLLQALNTGHQGMLSTIHANSAAQAISRFTTCVLLSGIELPYRAVRSNIAEAVNVIVQLTRRPGRRFVSEVLRIRGYEPDQDRFQLETLYAGDGLGSCH